MSHLQKLADDYFNFFIHKNKDLLFQMFASDVSLVDWEIKAFGIEDVSRSVLEVWEALGKFTVDVKNMFIDECKNVVVAELTINLENNQNIKVVDIISFDDAKKISSIKAYKG